MTLQYGFLTVYHSNVENFGFYLRHTFQLFTVNEKRIIQHLYFPFWPENDILPYPQMLAPFLKTVSSATDNSDAPVIIHGNTGIGRTGTVILCDIILKMARSDHVLDFLGTLQKLREQRQNMVLDDKQYKLAHLVIVEVLFGQDTSVLCDCQLNNELVEAHLRSTTNLEKQLYYVNEVYWLDQAMYSLSNKGMSSLTKRKYFSPVSHIEVDGFNWPAKFVVTQQPLKHLWTNFWELVQEKGATTIVCLNDIEQQNTPYSLFWPTKNNAEIKLPKFITVKYIKTKEYVNRDITTVSLTFKDQEGKCNKKQQCNKIINVIAIKGWALNETTPGNIKNLFDVWEEMEKVIKNREPVMVMCRDAVTASGLFVAFSFVVDRISTENICDVCFAVRMVRRNCQKYIQHKEQLELLYQAALQYLRDFRCYTYIEFNSTD